MQNTDLTPEEVDRLNAFAKANGGTLANTLPADSGNTGASGNSGSTDLTPSEVERLTAFSKANGGTIAEVPPTPKAAFTGTPAPRASVSPVNVPAAPLRKTPLLPPMPVTKVLPPAQWGTPGTPIYNDAQKFGGIVERPPVNTPHGVMTVATFAKRGIGGQPVQRFYGSAQEGGKPLPVTDPRVVGYKHMGPQSLTAGDFGQAFREGIAQGGDSIKGAATSLGQIALGGYLPQDVTVTGNKPVQAAPKNAPGWLKAAGNMAPSFGNLVSGAASLPFQAAAAGVDYAQTPHTDAERAVLSPLAVPVVRALDNMIPKNPAATQRTREFQQSNLNAAGLGPGGELEKLKNHDVAGAVSQIVDSFEEHPVEWGAGVIAGVDRIHASHTPIAAAIRDEAMRRADAYDSQADTGEDPATAQQLTNKADKLRAQARKIDATLPQSARLPVTPHTSAFPPAPAPARTISVQRPQIDYPSGDQPAAIQTTQGGKVKAYAGKFPSTPASGPVAIPAAEDIAPPAPLHADESSPAPVQDTSAQPGTVNSEPSEQVPAQAAAGASKPASPGNLDSAAPLPAISDAKGLGLALQQHFGYTAAEARATAAIADARAKTWASQTGRPVKEWYESRIADVTSNPDALTTAKPAGVAEKPIGDTRGPAASPQAPADAFAGATQGHAGTAYTADNTPVNYHWEVRPADDLITSHTESFAPNPAYDQSLQPRDRTRIASADQVHSMSLSLNPSRLTDSATTAEGAPITGPDMQVESGNARTMAIKAAYRMGGHSADAYRRAIIDRAGALGIDPGQVSGIHQPVLVRVRDTPVNGADARADMADRMGKSAVAAMSEPEVATIDGKSLRKSGALNKLVSGDDINLTSAANRPFVHAFMGDIRAHEAAGMMQADGSLSNAGIRRIKNAILASAYDDPATISRLTEDTDSNIRGVGNAMLSAAPKLARFKGMADKGSRYSTLDLTGDITDAANKLAHLRDTGTKVDTYLSQQGLFGEELSPEAIELLKTFDQHKRRPAAITHLLNTYADMADLAGDPSNGVLFDMPPSKADTLRAAQIRAQETDAKTTEAGSTKGNEGEPANRGNSASPLAGRDQAADTGGSTQQGTAASQGQVTPGTLFQSGRAAVEFREDGRAVIRALKAPDVSSALHELGHIFRRDLSEAAARGHDSSREDLAAVEQWAGVKNGHWTEAQDETFARAFERYLSEGQAPTLALTHVFAQFKAWLTNIYRNIAGSPLQESITPEVRRAFDRLLGQDEKSATAPKEADITSGPHGPSGKEYIGSLNESHMGGSAESRQYARANAERLGLNNKPVTTWGDIRAGSEQLGLQNESLQDLPVGQLPKLPNGDHVDMNDFINSVRNLERYNAEKLLDARKDLQAEDTAANRAVVAHLTKIHDISQRHADYWPNKLGQGFNALKIDSVPTRSERVMQSLREAPRLDSIEPQETASTAPQTPRRGQNRAAKQWGANNKGTSIERARQIEAEFKADREQLAAQYGQGLKGLIYQVIGDEEGHFDTDAAQKLFELAAFHIEAGARTATEFVSRMRASLGPGPSDADLHVLYAHARTKMAENITRQQRRAAGDALVDQLAGRFGSRAAVSKFLDQIAGPEGDNIILDRLLHGGTLDDTQRAILAQAYKDNAKKAPRRGPSTGALKAVDDIMDEARKAQRSQGRKSSGPASTPTPYDAMESRFASVLTAPRAKTVRAQIGEPVWRKIADGTASPGELRTAAAYYEAARLAKLSQKTAGTKAQPIPGFPEALRQYRVDQQAANSRGVKAYRSAPGAGPARTSPPRRLFGPIGPPTPESMVNTAIGRRVGMANVPAVRAALAVTQIGRDALANLEAGASLTDAQKLRIAHAIDDAKQPKNAAGSGSELARTLGGIARDAKAGKLNYDDPAMMAEDFLKQSIASGSGVTALAAKDRPAAVQAIMKPIQGELSKIERDADGKPTEKGYRQAAEIVNKYAQREGLQNFQLYVQDGLLSNPVLLAKIGLSHVLSYATHDIVDRPARYAVDQGIARKTGQVSIAPPSVADTFRSAAHGASKAQEIPNVLLHGTNPLTLKAGQATMHDLRPEFTTKNSIVNAAFRASLRQHAALYNMIGSAIYDRALREAAWTTAENERRSGAATTPVGSAANTRKGVTQRAKELYGSPTPEMLDQAQAEYHRQMFTNDNALHTTVQRAKNHNALTAAAGTVLLPFSKVPTNVVGRAVEYGVVPVGPVPVPIGSAISSVSQLLDWRKAGKLTGDKQAQLAGTISRGLTGTALTALGYYLTQKGIQVAADEKKHEYGGIKIGGREYETGGLGPILTPVRAGGAIYDMQQRQRETGRAQNPIPPVLDYLADQPLIKQMANYPAMVDPSSNTWQQKGAGLGVGLASELIPKSSFLRGMAAQTDPAHAIRSKRTAEDYAKNLIPGLRQTLPLALDPTGQPIPEAGGFQGIRNKPATPPNAFQHMLDLLDKAEDDVKNAKTLPEYTAAQKRYNALRDQPSVKEILHMRHLRRFSQ